MIIMAVTIIIVYDPWKQNSVGSGPEGTLRMYGAHLGSRLSGKILRICVSYSLLSSNTNNTQYKPKWHHCDEQRGGLSWVHCLTVKVSVLNIMSSPTHHSPSKYSESPLIRAGKVMSHLVERSASRASLCLAFLGGLTRCAPSNCTCACACALA